MKPDKAVLNQVIALSDQTNAMLLDWASKRPTDLTAILMVTLVYNKTQQWEVFDVLPDELKGKLVGILGAAIGDLNLRLLTREEDSESETPA